MTTNRARKILLTSTTRAVLRCGLLQLTCWFQLSFTPPHKLLPGSFTGSRLFILNKAICSLQIPERGPSCLMEPYEQESINRYPWVWQSFCLRDTSFPGKHYFGKTWLQETCIRAWHCSVAGRVGGTRTLVCSCAEWRKRKHQPMTDDLRPTNCAVPNVRTIQIATHLGTNTNKLYSL